MQELCEQCIVSATMIGRAALEAQRTGNVQLALAAQGVARQLLEGFGLEP